MSSRTGTGVSEEFDSQELRRRVAHAARALELSQTPGPEERRKVLEQRARDLARPAKAVDHAGTVEVVRFRIAGEAFAIESLQVLAAFTLVEIVPLPGAVAPTAGVTIWRGSLLMLLDVRAALGLSASALNDLRSVIVLGDARTNTGILVDSLEGVARMRIAELRDARPERLQQNTLIRGISSDAVTLIDGGALVQQHGTGGAFQ